MLHDLCKTYAVIDPWFGRLPHVPIELDMGCGFGSFTLALAQRFPDRLVLGTDLNSNRLRKIEKKAALAGLANFGLLHTTSLPLVGFMLPNACIRRIHLLCPDPWPKDKHRGRRLVTSDFLTRVARVLEPGGVLHMSTDHQPYFDALVATADGLPFFERAPEAIADIVDIKTDFERIWTAQGKSVPHAAYRVLK